LNKLQFFVIVLQRSNGQLGTFKHTFIGAFMHALYSHPER